MSYLGNSPTEQAFVATVDYFNGDGSTVAFTLSRQVTSAAQVQAVIENVPQNPSSAFTVLGNVITFTSAPPVGTANIYVYYTSPNTKVIAPSSGTVGTDALATGAVTATKLANGAARANFGAGAVLQVVQATYNGTVSSSSATLVDLGLSVTITPSSASSKILVMFSVPMSGGSNNSISGRVALLRDATTIFDLPSMFVVSVQYPTVVAGLVSESILDAPSTTSPVTYKVQVARNGYAGSYGGSIAFGNQGGTSVAACQITVLEIAG